MARAEPANTKRCRKTTILNVFSEQHQRSKSKLSLLVDKFEIAKNMFNTFMLCTYIQTLGVDSEIDEIIDNFRVYVVKRRIRFNMHIPCGVGLPHQKVGERCAIEFLKGAATTHVILAVAGHRLVGRLNANGNILFTFVRKDFNVGNHASGLDSFIGQVLQKVFGIIDSDYFARIIYSNVERTTLRVSKSANVGEIFVVPLLLIFYGLCFHSLSNLAAKLANFTVNSNTSTK